MDNRKRFILSNYFSYMGREWLRVVVYVALAAFMIWNLLYLDIVIKNNNATEYNFKNLKNAEYVRFDFGNIFEKLNNSNSYYDTIRKVIGEGNYAFSPWIVARNDDITLFATDEASLTVFDWELEWGSGFSANANEVIAFSGAADIGDTVTFAAIVDGQYETYDFEVVGVYGSDKLAVANQLSQNRQDTLFMEHNDDGLVFRYNSYLKNLNFVTNKYKGFIVNPRHELAQRNEVYEYSSGAFIKREVIDSNPKVLNELYACEMRNHIVKGDNTSWLFMMIMKAIFGVVLFALYVVIENILREKKYRMEYKTWNICGMSKNEIKAIYQHIFVLPVAVGFFLGFFDYMMELNRFTGKAWALVVISLSMVFYMFMQNIMNTKLITEKPYLLPNEGKEFLGNMADDTFPLLMNRSVRYNLRIPIELCQLDEDTVYSAVDRSLGIGYINSVSELKCKDLTDYELLRVKIARALTVMPKSLLIGSEWDKLNEKQQKELGRFLKLMAKNWNLQINFSQPRLESNQIVKEILECRDLVNKEEQTE